MGRQIHDRMESVQAHIDDLQSRLRVIGEERRQVRTQIESLTGLRERRFREYRRKLNRERDEQVNELIVRRFAGETHSREVGP